MTRPRLLSVAIGAGLAASLLAGCAAGSPTSSPSPSASDGKRAPADKLNLCGGTLADPQPDADGLVLSVDFPAEARVGESSIAGTATLANTGSEHIYGTTAPSPIVTLSQADAVLWHSNGAMIAMAAIVDLAPGGSMTFPASFSPTKCTKEDEADTGFRDNLPNVGAGHYQLSAAIDVLRTDSGGSFLSNDLVSGPKSTITLR